MVSIGPNSQSYNFTHMFDMGDLRGCPKNKPRCENSLMFLIDNNPDFSKFRYMVNLAKMDDLLDNIQADFTLFVPSDMFMNKIDDSVFVNMDIAEARHIVKSSMLDRKITSDLLSCSSAAFFNTKDPPNRLFISNVSGKLYINNDVNIIKADVKANNGIIHVIDKLLLPEML